MELAFFRAIDKDTLHSASFVAVALELLSFALLSVVLGLALRLIPSWWVSGRLGHCVKWNRVVRHKKKMGVRTATPSVRGPPLTGTGVASDRVNSAYPVAAHGDARVKSLAMNSGVGTQGNLRDDHTKVMESCFRFADAATNDQSQTAPSELLDDAIDLFASQERMLDEALEIAHGIATEEGIDKDRQIPPRLPERVTTGKYDRLSQEGEKLACTVLEGSTGIPPGGSNGASSERKPVVGENGDTSLTAALEEFFSDEKLLDDALAEAM
ncbi:hypothetical protein ERJ75_000754200 [Trypanosoma vivax]|uniref:Uncharacterized protein n=1 Tax=Trypanosoma vivax (strain Y486) TaxID=1055687 RepID=G0U027_TRYVY|nr:hypothetical protein TRVL_03318 [Trypanosoma vivax]KAH8614088.1 hypothetical protein ERJ75_000754200 [Trypanosoma vivax]CCC49424.1 conserved hypothetical protein [Trypanosoma vivax Y486]